MKEMKRRLLELEDAWRTLDGYVGHHAPGCPASGEPGGPCQCGLTNARSRLRGAVLDMLMHYAMHDPWCAGGTGRECDCGFKSVRRRLEALGQSSSPGGTGGGSPPPK